MFIWDTQMTRTDNPKRRSKEEMFIVPDFGYVRVLDRELQKQFDSLNETKKLNPGTSGKPYGVNIHRPSERDIYTGKESGYIDAAENELPAKPAP